MPYRDATHLKTNELHILGCLAFQKFPVVDGKLMTILM